MAPRGSPTKVIGVRVTEREETQILEVAKAADAPPSKWLKDTALAAADAFVPGPWWCDRCGEPIVRVQDGWVQWRCRLTERGTTCDKIEIVHHSGASPRGLDGCYPRGFEKPGVAWGDHHLGQFVGPAGGMRLLAIADSAPPSDLLIEVMSRLLVPGYEAARRLLPRAIHDGHLAQGTRLTLDLIPPILQAYAE